MYIHSVSKICFWIVIGIGISYLSSSLMLPVCFISKPLETQSEAGSVKISSSGFTQAQNHVQLPQVLVDNGPSETSSDAFRKRVQEIRVVCWIMTYPPKHNTSARSVGDTWGKRCDKIVFISNVNDRSLPAVAVSVPPDRNYLWGKTKRGFKYVFDHFFDDGDWFLKADDDTYVIMENLKLVLSQYDTQKPLHLGCQFNKFTPEGYMSGGAGYVLSKEALRRFIKQGLPDSEKCKKEDTGSSEDADIGKCLYNIGVKAADSRDALGRHRFFLFDLSYYTHGHITEYWFWNNMKYLFDENGERCSTTPISWHYIRPNMMYLIDYLLYVATVFGLQPAKPHAAILKNKTIIPFPYYTSGDNTDVLMT